MLGSIISNLLLVMGGAFIAGGINYKEQAMNVPVVNANTGLLLVAACPVVLITGLVTVGNVKSEDAVLSVSRFVALVMIVVYTAYFYFQLKTHAHFFLAMENDSAEEALPGVEMVAIENGRSVPSEWEAVAEDVYSDKSHSKLDVLESDLPDMNRILNDERQKNHSEVASEDELGLWGAIIVLAIITVLVSFLSDYLVFSIHHAAAYKFFSFIIQNRAWNIPQVFIGTILLPIVGNATEHAAAITVAYKNKINLSIGVCIFAIVLIICRLRWVLQFKFHFL